MLLKRIDETIAQGLYDLDAGPSEEEVYVAEPSIEGNVVLWEIVAGGMIPRDLLHYDDTPDGSTKFNGSWRDGLLELRVSQPLGFIFAIREVFSNGSKPSIRRSPPGCGKKFPLSRR